MPARIDNGNEFPGDIANRAYSDEFLTELAKRFRFDLSDEVKKELRHMAHVYIANLRGDNGEDWEREQRKRYRRLEKATLRFAKLVKEFEDDDIASDLFMAARATQNEKLVSDVLIAAQRKMSHNRFLYSHLMNLLELLAVTAEEKIKSHALPRGPKRNLGLQSITMHAIALWSVDFGRKFTVDYHKGAGLTEAFQFMRALIDPLDDVTDKQIM
ncbi:MAG: hypothetical protein ACREFD_15800 [Stellaceae bacterium]